MAVIYAKRPTTPPATNAVVRQGLQGFKKFRNESMPLWLRIHDSQEVDSLFWHLLGHAFPIKDPSSSYLSPKFALF
jgi:hypothetical protein